MFDFLLNPYTIENLLIEFVYFSYVYIQLEIFNVIIHNNKSFSHFFYRDTAIGRRLAYRKFGTPNSIMWHTYARRHNFNRAYDRVKYFYIKELLDTSLEENIETARRIKTERSFYL